MKFLLKTNVQTIKGLDKLKDLYMDKLLIFAIIVIVGLILGPLIAMLGWWLFMVPVFGLPSLTFLQALGLTLLTGAGGAIFKAGSSSK